MNRLRSVTQSVMFVQPFSSHSALYWSQGEWHFRAHSGECLSCSWASFLRHSSPTFGPNDYGHTRSIQNLATGDFRGERFYTMHTYGPWDIGVNSDWQMKHLATVLVALTCLADNAMFKG